MFEINKNKINIDFTDFVNLSNVTNAMRPSFQTR